MLRKLETDFNTNKFANPKNYGKRVPSQKFLHDE